MKIGKLDSNLLEEIVFKHIKYKREEVLVRPGIGKDCAIVDYGEDVCVLSTDPITGAASEVGKLAIHVSCNDIASEGVEPLGIMLTVMVPESTTEEEIEFIMKQAADEAEKLHVEIIGGHTEVTHAVNKPVIVSTAIGKGKKDAYTSQKEVQVGDSIILTKYAGLEGTGIIAYDYEEELKAKVSMDVIDNAKSFLEEISVVEEGLIGGRLGATSMHDVTEGGILGAVWETCQSSKLGARIRVDAIPVKEETLKICDVYGIDYLRLISSGCMLMTISADKKDNLLKQLKAKGILATAIGVMTEKDVIMVKDGKDFSIDPPDKDELYKV
ncbi:MAG: AIR synthase family protein [Peptostreptococcales bacterium]